ncbi:DUF4198 domain-containing protein [Catenovulum adriaticum]|uniref:DUF4198 domain-containing protein n=1 Tax=Catenovulum adriaticum TaxID=2984846 RepID=A0ABY7ALQ4_9ALTE|nr:DUF4198 domain-containing protein [Catenovulum sp. TS8]WAJ70071.1 DUF4198 domain-containing protein [Catenovulum sp. TS8]
MLPIKLIKTAVLPLALILVTSQANAHRAWIKPSESVLSGEENYVTFDAAVSNTLFLPEHVAYPTKSIEATGPDGKKLELENAATGKYRSTFDLKLTQSGTYRISSASAGIRAMWRDDEGNRKMWPPRRGGTKGETFETAVPKNAKDLNVSFSSRRVETFVTLGELSKETLKPTNQGLELVPVTHPNDLYATETAEFIMLIDGSPAVDAEVEVNRGAMRYRNDPETINVKTDEKGKFTVTWPKAGMYFIEVSYQDDKAKAPATSRRGGYSGVFEVLPL